VKLSLRSAGGFTGPAGAMTRTFDLETLPEARRLLGRALVEAAHVFDRPAKTMLTAPHPWDFIYTLETNDGARSHRIEFHLDAVDDSLRALVTWLEGE